MKTPTLFGVSTAAALLIALTTTAPTTAKAEGWHGYDNHPHHESHGNKHHHNAWQSHHQPRYRPVVDHHWMRPLPVTRYVTQPPAPRYAYYCNAPRGYYPYVNACYNPWSIITVAP